MAAAAFATLPAAGSLGPACCSSPRSSSMSSPGNPSISSRHAGGIEQAGWGGARGEPWATGEGYGQLWLNQRRPKRAKHPVVRVAKRTDLGCGAGLALAGSVDQQAGDAREALQTGDPHVGLGRIRGNRQQGMQDRGGHCSCTSPDEPAVRRAGLKPPKVKVKVGLTEDGLEGCVADQLHLLG